LDGIINQGTFSSTSAVAPIIDAIEEFKVHSHNDDAEFGEVTGGIINVVTKSGTNRFHDAAWDRVPSVDNKYRSASAPRRLT